MATMRQIILEALDKLLRESSLDRWLDNYYREQTLEKDASIIPKNKADFVKKYAALGKLGKKLDYVTLQKEFSAVGWPEPDGGTRPGTEPWDAWQELQTAYNDGMREGDYEEWYSHSGRGAKDLDPARKSEHAALDRIFNTIGTKAFYSRSVDGNGYRFYAGGEVMDILRRKYGKGNLYKATDRDVERAIELVRQAADAGKLDYGEHEDMTDDEGNYHRVKDINLDEFSHKR